MPTGLLWDVFCRVVDNHGDLGVCWRLARDLTGRGERVRLWVDDASALAWMAPQGAPGVELRTWADEPAAAPGEVVIEAFGCDPPPAFVQAMGRRRPAPVWINLEYLSAEPYVERSHGLPSPQPGGLIKWFFFPGFTPRSGGLLREPGLLQQQQGFDGRAWLAARGWAALPQERVISLFCYPRPAGDETLALLAGPPTLVLATPGHASDWLRRRPLPEGLRVVELPWLSQPDYDRLLWSCALNAVRGEDSFVRALWAPAPLLWQIYPQHDGVHARKLEAFVDRYLDGAPAALAAAVRHAMRHWNGLGDAPAAAPDPAAWHDWHMTWRKSLSMQDDLVTQLRRFVQGRSGLAC